MSAPILRCKMRVDSVLRVMDADGSLADEVVKLRAIYGGAGSYNTDWAKYTPAAHFEITISNPAAQGQLSSGHKFWVDFTPA